jgi:hypothetical protein
MQILGRTVSAALLGVCLAAHAAEPDAAQATAGDTQPAAARGPAASESDASPVLASPVQAGLQTVVTLELPAAGICPVIDELVQQSCAQYPADPGCSAQ